MNKTLSEYQKECPELTFNNDGYEYLSYEIQDKYKKEIKEIESILNLLFNQTHVEFNNFKPYKNGFIDVRCQYRWDSSFRGVGYFNIEKLDNELKDLFKK